jgi:hypothetical protein
MNAITLSAMMMPQGRPSSLGTIQVQLTDHSGTASNELRRASPLHQTRRSVRSLARMNASNQMLRIVQTLPFTWIPIPASGRAPPCSTVDAGAMHKSMIPLASTLERFRDLPGTARRHQSLLKRDSCQMHYICRFTQCIGIVSGPCIEPMRRRSGSRAKAMCTVCIWCQEVAHLRLK